MAVESAFNATAVEFENLIAALGLLARRERRETGIEPCGFQGLEYRFGIVPTDIFVGYD